MELIQQNILNKSQAVYKQKDNKIVLEQNKESNKDKNKQTILDLKNQKKISGKKINTNSINNNNQNLSFKQPKQNCKKLKKCFKNKQKIFTADIQPPLQFLQNELKSLTQTLRILECPICYQPYTYQQNSDRLPIIICQNQKYNIIHSICKLCYKNQFDIIKQNNKIQQQRRSLVFSRQIFQQLANYRQLILEERINHQQQNDIESDNQSQEGQINLLVEQSVANQTNQQHNPSQQQAQINEAPDIFQSEQSNNQRNTLIIVSQQDVQPLENSSSYEDLTQSSYQYSASISNQSSLKGKCPLCRKQILFQQVNFKYHNKLIDWLKLSKQLNIKLPKQSIQKLSYKFKGFLQKYSRRKVLIDQQQKILNAMQQQRKQSEERDSKCMKQHQKKLQSLQQIRNNYFDKIPLLKRQVRLLQSIIDKNMQSQQFKFKYKEIFKKNDNQYSIFSRQAQQFLQFHKLKNQIDPLVSQIKFYTQRQFQLIKQQIQQHVQGCNLCRYFYRNHKYLKFDNKIIFGYNQQINSYYSWLHRVNNKRNCTIFLRLINKKKQQFQKIDFQRIKRVKQLHGKLSKNAFVIIKFIQLINLFIDHKEQNEQDILQKYQDQSLNNSIDEQNLIQDVNSQSNNFSELQNQSQQKIKI